MKLLFITIGAVYDFGNSGVYTDLLKKFALEGHEVYVAGAVEKRTGKKTSLSEEYGIKVLRIKTGNITKTNLLEKGISTLTIGYLYSRAIKKYWGNIKFDFILYTTPPITIAGMVGKLKRKYNAFTYLLLKDIFPQNAADIGILTQTGIKGFIYRYFRMTEKKLYLVSDKIGCMSQANVDFVKKNNPYLPEDIIEICPNTVDAVTDFNPDKGIMTDKYDLPRNKYLLLYGGNFGKPQNVRYIIEAIDSCRDITDVHFVLCGSGTDFGLINDYIEKSKPANVSVIDQLPYNEYSELAAECDIGLIFLDYRFTIPNFPSRLLDYMNYGLPVIAATDKNTDVGKTVADGGFGWWIESREPQDFHDLIKEIFSEKEIKQKINEMSVNAREYLKNNFETSRAYSILMKAYEEHTENT